MKFRLPFLLIALAPLCAAVPNAIPHQGRVMVDGTTFDNTGSFKFLLFADADADHSNGNEIPIWSNESSSPVATTEPTTALSLGVSDGLFSVLLGDTSVPGMAALPASIDPGPGSFLYLRTWFDDGVNGSQQLSPDHSFGSVPFALNAAQGFSLATSDIDLDGFDVNEGGVFRSDRIVLGTPIGGPFGKAMVWQDSDTSSSGLGVANSTGLRVARFWVDGNDVSRLDSGATGSSPLALNAGGGNVGIGTDDPQAELDVAGDVMTSGSFSYAAPKTFYKAIPGAAFMPDHSSDEFDRGLSSGTIRPVGSTFQLPLIHDLDLPDGATITGIELYYRSGNTAGDIGLVANIYRNDLNTGVFGIQMLPGSISEFSTGTAGFQTVSESVPNVLIDHENTSHQLHVRVDTSAARTPLNTFNGVRLEYTMSQVNP